LGLTDVAPQQWLHLIGGSGLGAPPPTDGSSQARSIYGGAERASFLASGLFTGESRWNPPQRPCRKFWLNIKTLRDRTCGLGGFLLESGE